MKIVDRGIGGWRFQVIASASLWLIGVSWSVITLPWHPGRCVMVTAYLPGLSFWLVSGDPRPTAPTPERP